MARKISPKHQRPVLPQGTRREVYTVRLPPALVARLTPHGTFTAVVERALAEWLDRR